MWPSYCLLCVSYISIPGVSVDLPGLQIDIEEFVTGGELEPLFYTPVTLAPDTLPAKEEKIMHPGAGPGGPECPPFGGPPNFIEREKTLCVYVRICRVLVLNSYPDPPPPVSFYMFQFSIVTLFIFSFLGGDLAYFFSFCISLPICGV